MDFIDRCLADVGLTPLSGTVLRLVESQEKVATTRIVSTLERQALLEDILERSKPPLPAIGTTLHWLLATPFRYPPLRHGSRFGAPLSPACFMDRGRTRRCSPRVLTIDLYFGMA